MYVYYRFFIDIIYIDYMYIWFLDYLCRIYFFLIIYCIYIHIWAPRPNSAHLTLIVCVLLPSFGQEKLNEAQKRLWQFIPGRWWAVVLEFQPCEFWVRIDMKLTFFEFQNVAIYHNILYYNWTLYMYIYMLCYVMLCYVIYWYVL